jgi:hypothetical protein
VFFLFGTKTVDRDVKNAGLVRAHCSFCGYVSDFRRQRRARYFELYFLPVFPIERAKEILTCNRCGASCLASNPAFPQETTPDKAVLTCPACSEKMRVPVKLANNIKIRCPHCRGEFTVNASRT